MVSTGVAAPPGLNVGEKTRRAGPVATGFDAATDATEYPPIGDYALIGDCRTAALVSRQGSIDWLCLPDFSSPSVFAALLDRHHGGRFAIRPAAPFRTERRYVEDTNVLETLFITATGRLRVTDFVALSGVGEAGLDPECEVVRIVEGLEGETDIEVLFEPRLDYGRADTGLVGRGTLGWACERKGEALLLRSELDLDLVENGSALHIRTTIGAGEQRRLSLVYAKHDVLVIPALGVEADRRLAETSAWWRNWSRQCRYDGPYRPAVLRSVLALKLLTSSLSGAVIAAATTSLPEWVGAERNYDYRFCWLRDASTTLRAFFGLGFSGEGEAFLEWLLHSTRLTRPELRVVYDVFGRTEVSEERLDHLEGYRGSRPVRIGNKAVEQFQLDVYGTVIHGALTFVEHGGSLHYAERGMLRQFGKLVCKRWREPDNGLWEIGGERRQYTHSKLMCWVALNSLIHLHEKAALKIPVEAFRRERKAIAEAIEARGFDTEQKSYVANLDGTALDASLLVMAQVGYKDANDPRLLSTLERVQHELGRDGLFYRYTDGFDRIPSPEGAFGICSFWAVELLALQGKVEEGARLFERMLTLGNDLGLMAEEFDPATGEALGNFPQAYTHAGLITAALALHEAERRRSGRADEC